MLSTQRTLLPIVFLFMTILLWTVALQPAKAASATLMSEPGSSYFELLAKVEYLKAFIEALKNDKESPAPTFITTLQGDTVSLVGTLARDPDSTRMELCGPMEKGQVDWGDGIVEPIRGLGCSGDVHTFTLHHRYDTDGSYEIEVEDSTNRDTSHMVAVRVTDNDSAPTVKVVQDNEEVTVTGKVILDDSLPASCAETLIAAMVWGDGSAVPVTTTCTKTTFSFSHTYSTPGVYKMYVRDKEGDITQALITVK